LREWRIFLALAVEVCGLFDVTSGCKKGPGVVREAWVEEPLSLTSIDQLHRS
jgi:hypothetical protein